MGHAPAHEIVHQPADPRVGVDLGQVTHRLIVLEVMEGHGGDDHVDRSRMHGEPQSVALEKRDLRIGGREATRKCERGAPAVQRQHAKASPRPPRPAHQRDGDVGGARAHVEHRRGPVRRQHLEEAPHVAKREPPSAEESVEAGDGVKLAGQLAGRGRPIHHLHCVGGALERGRFQEEGHLTTSAARPRPRSPAPARS